MLPFTPEQFIAVFVAYNHAIWPMQIAAILLGGVAVALLIWRMPASDRVVAGILAAFWLWTGISYHAIWFSAVNRAAYLFAALFIVQGCSLIHAGVYRHGIRFGLPHDVAARVGAGFVAYVAIVYPLIGLTAGHSYPAMPMFGVTPCPVTIFTFGMLLLTTAPVSRWLLVIPVLWSLVGGSAAILLDVPQDWLLLVSGGVTVFLMARRDRRMRPCE